MKWYGDDFLKKLNAAAKEALDEAADQVLDNADGKVPVVTGELKNSRTKDGDDTEVVFGYDKEYAPIVHENPNSTGYKFLEQAIQEETINIRRTLKRKLEEGLK